MGNAISEANKQLQKIVYIIEGIFMIYFYCQYQRFFMKNNYCFMNMKEDSVQKRFGILGILHLLRMGNPLIPRLTSQIFRWFITNNFQEFPLVATVSILLCSGIFFETIKFDLFLILLYFTLFSIGLFFFPQEIQQPFEWNQNDLVRMLPCNPILPLMIGVILIVYFCCASIADSISCGATTNSFLSVLPIIILCLYYVYYWDGVIGYLPTLESILVQSLFGVHPPMAAIIICYFFLLNYIQPRMNSLEEENEKEIAFWHFGNRIVVPVLFCRMIGSVSSALTSDLLKNWSWYYFWFLLQLGFWFPIIVLFIGYYGFACTLCFLFGRRTS